MKASYTINTDIISFNQHDEKIYIYHDGNHGHVFTDLSGTERDLTRCLSDKPRQ